MTSDTLLIGSFVNQAYGNYDGKYLEDSGNLYLIYSKRLESSPTAQDGIVAQPMTSAKQLSGSAYTVLLAPENNADGGYNSEAYSCGSVTSTLKLIETGNIAVVAGKCLLRRRSDPAHKTRICGSAHRCALRDRHGEPHSIRLTQLSVEQTRGQWDGGICSPRALREGIAGGHSQRVGKSRRRAGVGLSVAIATVLMA